MKLTTLVPFSGKFSPPQRDLLEQQMVVNTQRKYQFSCMICYVACAIESSKEACKCGTLLPATITSSKVIARFVCLCVLCKNISKMSTVPMTIK